MFQISFDNYVIWVGDATFRPLPFSIDYAVVNDIFDRLRLPNGFGNNDIETCIVAVQHYNEPPFLVVQQYYWPGKWSGCTPAILYVPETNVLFIGTGSNTLCYTLLPPKRMLEQGEPSGNFKLWRRVGNIILQEHEEGLVAWNLSGEVMWSIYAYFDMEYKVEDGVVHVIQDDIAYAFPLDVGPPQK